MNKQDQIIDALDNLNINAAAEPHGPDVEVIFFCWAIGRQQVLVRFNGDADPKKVAQVCEGIRALIDLRQ